MKTKIGLLLLVLVMLGLVASTSAPVDQGNINLSKVCSDQGLTLVLVENNAYGWKCTAGTGFIGMDLDGACRSQYSWSFVARYRDYNDPFSWMCMPNVSTAFIH